MVSAQYISEEIFDDVSQNLVDRRTLISNLVTLILFSRSRRSFKMVSTQYLKTYLMYPYQNWYTDAPGEDRDQVWTGWTWPKTFFSSTQRSFKIVFVNIWRNIWWRLTNSWYTQAPGQGDDQAPTLWPWPCFQGLDGHLRWFFPQYLKAYLM